MSDLLNQASLVMVPSGYKEDTVFSVVPSDGSGDLSFTRASNGTRINSAGLVEVVAWNIMTYSEQFQNADWIGGGNGKPTMSDNFAEAPNGTMTASKMESATDGYQLRQNNAQENTQMNLSVWLRTNTGTKTIQLFLNNASTASQNITVTTTWTRYEISGLVTSLSGGGRNGLNTLEALTSSNYILVWGFQLSLGLTAKPYFPTTDRLNVPRLTYQNGGGGCPSLLLEKQSTNLAFPSEDLTAWGTGGMTNTANQTISPDGTQNADKSTIGSTTRYYDAVDGVVTTVGGTVYTTSFYAKKGTGIEAVYFYQGDGGAKAAKWNLNNGAYIGYAPADGYSAFTSQTSESIGNGWYRFTATYTASSTSGNYVIGVSTNTNDSVTTIAGNGTDFVYIWGLQCEASSYPTSYIPTTSSSATRVADACRKTGISSLIGQTEGTMFVDVVTPTAMPSGTEILPISIFPSGGGTGGTQTYISFLSNGVVRFVYFDGAIQALITTASGFWSAGNRYKLAAVYKQNDFAFYINGLQIGVGNTGNVSAMSDFYLDYQGAVEQNTVNQAILFKTRLSNSELASLTTI